MPIDVYTKSNSAPISSDLCENVEIRADVRNFYNKYKGRCEPFLSSIITEDNTERKCYVYTWYTRTEPKRYFYVGKGTGHRYDHILYEIKKYKNGLNNSRFRLFSEIQEKWGIDYDIVVRDLTSYEALIYEQCLKLEFIDNGEVLLNVEGISYESLSGDRGIDKASATVPRIIKAAYYERYFDDFDIPFFDKVSSDGLMKTHIYPYFLNPLDPAVIGDKEFIISHLKNMNAKLYKTVSEKTASVIVQGDLMYDRYLDYRKRGKNIYSSKDIIEYFQQINE